MKKLLSLSVGVLFTCLLAAQESIPDGTFESLNIPTNSYWDPQYYNTSNDQNWANGIDTANVTETTGYNGVNYGVQLQTINTSQGTQAGFIINGNLTGNNITGGIPFSQKPTGIRFYYKYAPSGTDTAAALVIFKKSGILIDSFLVTIPNAAASYTLRYYYPAHALPTTPDTVIVGFASSLAALSKNRGGSPGSTLVIDSVTFTGVSSQPVDLNGDFQNWISSKALTLTGWYINYPYVTRTTDAESGKYALELETINYQYSIEQGQASTGYYPNNCSSNCNEMGGFAYTRQIDTLEFGYKYFPAIDDTANISLNFIKNGQSVYYTGISFYSTNTVYKDTIVPFNVGEAPDTVIVNITSSSHRHDTITIGSQYAPYVGSTLKIDNLAFTSQKKSLAITMASETTILCTGETGNATANAAIGGNPPYTYSWSPSGESNTIASNLSAGTYTITVTDNKGFMAIASTTLTQPNILSVSAANSNPNSYCNYGIASAYPSGGTSPYTYSWSDGGNNSNATGLSAATYTITIEDNNGCYVSDTVTINHVSPAANLLCWTTVDTTSLHNLISWDTIGTGGESIDSVLLYFLNASNVWQKIGEESYNDPNQYFVDSTSNPNAVTVRYCVETVDNCGDSSGYSTWQNTMFISNSGIGTFSWGSTGYLIEGNSLPVLTYYLFRNDSIIDSVSGTQYKMTDVNYSSTATYWVGAKLSISICALSPIAIGHRSELNGSVSNLSRSNIINKKPTGIENISNSLSINIYPDPNTGSFTVAGITQGEIIELYNYTGQMLNSVIADNNTTIHFDISDKANGIYLIRILNKDGSVVTQQKIVKAQ